MKYDYSLTEKQDEIRQLNGISQAVFKSRIRKKWSKQRAVSRPLAKPKRMDRQLKQTLMRHGITMRMYHQRLQNDWSFQDAMTVEPKRNSTIFSKLTHNQIQIMIENDLTYEDYQSRRNNDWTHEEAIFTPRNVVRFDLYEHELYPLTLEDIYTIFEHHSTIDTYRMNRALGYTHDEALIKPKRKNT